MGGAVVDAQGPRPPPNIDAQGFPGKRLLKNPLTKVSGEEKSVGPPPSQGRKQPQLGDIDILGLIHHRISKRKILALGNDPCHFAEHLGIADQLACHEQLANLGKDQPEQQPLLFRQPGFTAQPSNVPVCLPGLKLPGIHHLFPFAQEKVQTELVALNSGGRLRYKPTDDLAGSHLRSTEMQFVKPSTNGVHGMHFQAFAKTRFSADQSTQFGVQGSGQGVGKGGKQHPCFGVAAGQEDGPVQSHDGLARSG